MGRPVLLVVAILALPTAEAGAAQFTPWAVAEHEFVSDNQRWVAYDVDESTTRVVDTSAGAVRDVPTPPACRSPYAYWAQGYPVAAGNGQLAWSCNVVMSFETGSIRPVPADRGRFAYDSCSTIGIGTYWMWQSCSGYHYHTDLFVNWWTGERKDAFKQKPGQVPDVNTPALWRKPCSPLHPRKLKDEVSENHPPFGRFLYRHPVGIDLNGPLALGRCGKRATTVLTKDAFSDVAFAWPTVRWFEGLALKSYDVRTKKRRSYALSPCRGNVPGSTASCVFDGRFRRTERCVFRLDTELLPNYQGAPIHVSVADAPGADCPL
jgi:hypothetical protein